MTAVGVICEYNPFHNGHAHQLLRAREASGAAFVVCVMSGHFTQRGTPALLNPWTRARMALLHGADVVLELPALFAVRPAQQFALGGVSILEALGVEALSFGSENSDTAMLWRLADVLREEPEVFRQALQAYLSQGLPYPSARSKALADALGLALPNAPNISLALEYLQALRRLDSGIQVYPVQRQGEQHHSKTLTPLASASAIREALFAQNADSVRDTMPTDCHALLTDAIEKGAYVHPEGLDTLILYALRRSSPEQLEQLPDMAEGLESLIYNEARRAATVSALLAQVKSKRYPYARLSRLLCYALLDLSRPLTEAYPTPPYVRLLGFRREAGPLLRRFHEAGRIPLITRGADKRLLHHPAFALEQRASDTWSLGTASVEMRTGGQLFSHPPVIL